MTKITTFSRPAAAAFQEAAMAALRQVAAAHGVTLGKSRGTIGIGAVDLKLAFDFKVADAAAREPGERKKWNEYCADFGLLPEQFGATFPSRGQTWEVIGIEPKKRTFPVRARSEEGKELLFTPAVFRLATPAAKAA